MQMLGSGGQEKSLEELLFKITVILSSSLSTRKINLWLGAIGRYQ